MLAGGLLTATAATRDRAASGGRPTRIPSAIRPWVNSIDSYLKQHPDLHAQLQAKSEAEGGGPNVIDYLNRHPDVRQHLIDLSQQCTP